METMLRRKPSKSERFLRAIQTPQAVVAEQSRRSLFRFMKEFWLEVSSETFKPNWHIEYLCGKLEKLARRVGQRLPREHDLIINLPPGSTKSMTVSVMFPAWCWVNWPWMRFIAGSYSGALSLEHAEKSRDIIRSEKFMQMFPALGIKQDKDTKSNFKIQSKFIKDGRIKVLSGGNRYSTSVGGTLMGFHGDILLIDDPIDPHRAASPVELKTVNDWIDQTLSTRKTDKLVTPTVLIMQRLHQSDPTGHTLAKRKSNVLHICLPGEIANHRAEVNPPELVADYQGDLLDLVRLSWDALNDMRANLGQYGYAGQVGQRPTPPGGGMFKVDRFSHAETFDPVHVRQTVRYWDKAGTADGAAACTVGVKMALLDSGKFLVLDVVRGQWESHDRERIIKSTAEVDGRAVVVWMEQEPGSGGKESAQGTIRNLAGHSVHAERPTGDKIYRADPYSVQVNDGNVILLRGDWNAVFVEEHRFFPHGTRKDQVDAAAGAFNKLAQKRVAGSVLSRDRRSASVRRA